MAKLVDVCSAYWLPALLIAVYLALVADASYRIVLRAPATAEAHYKAARLLPINTRLRQEDVIKPTDLPSGYFWYLPNFEKDLKGRYLAVEVKANEVIKPADLRPHPSALVDGPVITLPLSSQAGLSDLLNAGVKVKLCADHCYDGDTWALVCGPGDRNCYGTFRLSPSDSKAVWEGKKVTILINSGVPKNRGRSWGNLPGK